MEAIKKIKRRLIRAYARRVIALMLKTEAVPCPLCGAREGFKTLQTKDRYGLQVRTVKCACGFVFENPMPTEAFLSRFYKTHLFRALDWGVIRTSHSVTSEFEARARAQKHLNLLGTYLGTKLTWTSSVLDIGASEGSFLKLLGETYGNTTRYAVEPGSNFSRLIDQGVRVVWKSVEDISPESKFDLITLWHVLEHVSDPRSFIQKAVSHLSVGGYLVIEVPSTDRYDTSMRPYHVDHTLHFGRETLERLLVECGLVVEHATIENNVLMDPLYGLAVIARLP